MSDFALTTASIAESAMLSFLAGIMLARCDALGFVVLALACLALGISVYMITRD